MAVLSDPERAALTALFQHDFSSRREAIAGVLKADIRAAINAADQWAEDNKVSYNSALPLPARTALTASQKAAILMYIIKRRFEVGS